MRMQIHSGQKVNAHTPKWFLFFLSVACFAGSSLPAWADGMYFAENKEKVQIKTPSIPTQKALIVYKNKTEKLMIESSLDGEGQNFGWIVPVPAKPTKVEKSSPGLMTTLSLNMEPDIVHDRSEDLRPLYGVPILIMVWILIALLMPSLNRVTLTIRLIGLLMLYVLLVHFTDYFSDFVSGRAGGPSLSSSERRDFISTVRVLQSSMIGNYDVTVLTAGNADDLNTWLTQNEFTPLSDRGRQIAGEYIQDKWVFVVSKLHRTDSGVSMPHPLVITFPTDRPVYPMKLTSLVKKPVSLELFVASENEARTDRRLDLEMADRFYWTQDFEYNQKAFNGKFFESQIGHSDLLNFLWDSCAISKFTGTLKPGQMAHDFYFTFSDFQPYRRTLYSSQGAMQTALFWTIILGGIIFSVAFIWAYKPIKHDCGMKRSLPLAALLCVLLWSSIFLTLPRVEVTILPETRVLRYQIETSSFSTALASLDSKIDKTIDIANLEQVRKHFADYFADHPVINTYTGEHIRYEESPGNYNVTNKDNHTTLIIYDRRCFPISFWLNQNRKPRFR